VKITPREKRRHAAGREKRSLEREKASLPVDVGCYKTPLLKLYLTTAASVAQLVEPLTAEREVMGSIPGPNQYLRCENN